MDWHLFWTQYCTLVKLQKYYKLKKVSVSVTISVRFCLLCVCVSVCVSVYVPIHMYIFAEKFKALSLGNNYKE